MAASTNRAGRDRRSWFRCKNGDNQGGTALLRAKTKRRPPDRTRVDRESDRGAEQERKRREKSPTLPTTVMHAPRPIGSPAPLTTKHAKCRLRTVVRTLRATGTRCVDSNWQVPIRVGGGENRIYVTRVPAAGSWSDGCRWNNPFPPLLGPWMGMSTVLRSLGGHPGGRS